MSHPKLPVFSQKEEKNPSWYSDGLRFSCTECGKCCTGAPGAVWVTMKEIQEIAAHLKLSIEEFAMKYLRSIHGRLSLKEHPTNYDCIFLKGKKCTIYQHRPTQCRTFPWWPENLSSKKNWEETRKECEGINDEAPLVSFETIQKGLREYEEGTGSKSGS